jgi:hypothetical protein
LDRSNKRAMAELGLFHSGGDARGESRAVGDELPLMLRCGLGHAQK